MGKKKHQERNDDPPEYATENEKKKSRGAAYNQLSTETLLIREKEVTQELVKLQNELNQMRTTIEIHYRSDALRQMNTKRYRAEYALGEIKAEIERRARKKLGQAIPTEGIQSGSASGVAAVTAANTSYTKIRETMANCTSVLADTITETKEKERMEKEYQKFSRSLGIVKKPEPKAQSGAASSSQESAPIGPQGPQMPQMPQMPQRPQMPQMNEMGVNFHGGSAMQAMAMMGAMGGPSAATAMASTMPTAEEMAAAAMQFQRMMGMMGQASGAPSMAANMAQPAAKPAAAPPSNIPAGIPAGIAKKFKVQQG